MACLKRSATTSSPMPAVTDEGADIVQHATLPSARRNRQAPHWRGPRGAQAAGAAHAASAIGVPRVSSAIDADIVAVAPLAGQKPSTADGLEPALVDDLLQHRLRVVEQRTRRLADVLVVEDRRDICRSSSQVEKNGDQSIVGDQLLDRIVLEHARCRGTAASPAVNLRQSSLRGVARARPRATAAACPPGRAHGSRRCGHIPSRISPTYSGRRVRRHQRSARRRPRGSRR